VQGCAAAGSRAIDSAAAQPPSELPIAKNADIDPASAAEPRGVTADTAGHHGVTADAGHRCGVTEHPVLDPLGVTADAAARAGEALQLAARHLDPSLVDVLRILGFDEEYVTASGSYLYDAAGRAYLDFHTGEGFASLGHNHADVRDVLRATLAADTLDGVQIHYSPLAGMLAEELTRRLPDGLDAVFFASTGAEAVDAAIKFARAATRRPRLLSCESGFHGVTLGPLSLVGDAFFKEGFGPLLPGCELVPFGDLERLEAQLRRRDVAAFVVEPIQGRTVALPPPGYLRAAQELCRRYGTMFVIDEIQTGLGRTGRWFALEQWGLEPDFVLVGKALSGGYMPVAAMVTTREHYQRAVGTLERSYVHQSTFGRNRMSMAAGLATLRVIERDHLVERAARIGGVLRDGLTELRSRHEMIKEVRAGGLMIGIELGAPSSRGARLNWRLIHMASAGLFPQLVVIPLHRDHGVITMAAGKNDVIKLLPPLTLSEDEAQRFLGALDAVLADCHGAAGKNWGVVRDIATATLRRRAPQGPDASEWTPYRGRPVDPARDDVCLITGASGFIGGRLAQRLVQDGHEVRCLVRASSDTSMLEDLDVEIAVGDLTSARSLARAVAGCDYVFHCGALVSDWATTEEIARTNVAGTRSLLEASVGASVQRFIHFSTTDVYGYPGEPAIDESFAGTRFRNWYAQTKRDAESEVRRVETAHALDAVILRPATVYGPGSKDVVGEIARAIRARNMLLVDGGRAVAGLCYVDNLLDAALLALRHERAGGQAFNISDGLAVTWREFTDAIAEGLGCAKVRWSVPYWLAHGLGFSLEHGYRMLRRTIGLHAPPLLSRQAVHVLAKDQDFSSRRAQEVLGWRPRVDYSTGLQATVDWLRAEYLEHG
jgi:ornithine--oxo-acid transaminase